MKVKLLSGMIGATSILFLVGCSSQPDVNKYVNPKIKNAQLKQQTFKEDSLRCELYAHNSISGQNRTYYIDTSNNTGSGNFDMTNTTTGQQYSGTYNSYDSGSFSSGLARGSAVGDMWAQSIKENSMRDKAWEYCMLRVGWHSTQ